MLPVLKVSDNRDNTLPTALPTPEISAACSKAVVLLTVGTGGASFGGFSIFLLPAFFFDDDDDDDDDDEDDDDDDDDKGRLFDDPAR